ncbi:hypothetical protein DM860_005813 [Cuscuta australis]|uniref:X8 domain-containing protein n=1 Tax=Cuscuta australis TaxID=267555 RepID=A0A328DVE3_9ASTE|nr:hypothetical protein DM860_005813 [Cuscuta australis]
MAVFVFFSVLFLALLGHSRANYCVCNDGVSDSQLQKNIDYACGNGADCRAINQNGVCYNPNTVKAHCNYAVNSYYQNKGQTAQSCDFSGTATVTSTQPATASGTCSYPTTAGTGTTGGGTTTSPTAGTTTPTTGGGTGIGTGTGGTGMGTGTGTGTGMGTGVNPTPFGGVGVAPTGGINTTPDGSAAAATEPSHGVISTATIVLLALSLAFAPRMGF